MRESRTSSLFNKRTGESRCIRDLIENKIGLKKIHYFRSIWCSKTQLKTFQKNFNCKKVKISSDFLLAARIESFILEKVMTL